MSLDRRDLRKIPTQTQQDKRNIILQNFNSHCNRYLKAWINTSNIDPQAQTSQTTSFRKARSSRVIPLGGTTNYYKIVDLLHNVVVSLLELRKVCLSVSCLAMLHHRTRWCRRNLPHRNFLYSGLARL
jgi:hypothetical protein